MDMDTEEVEVEVEVMITMTKDSEISGVDSEEGSVEVLTVLGSLINEIRIKNETEIRKKMKLEFVPILIRPSPA